MLFMCRQHHSSVEFMHVNIQWNLWYKTLQYLRKSLIFSIIKPFLFNKVLSDNGGIIPKVPLYTEDDVLCDRT